MTPNEFDKAFFDAAPGQVIVYRRAVGVIVHRTATVERAWSLACAGFVDLVQRRRPGGVFEYAAIKRRRPDAAPVTPKMTARPFDTAALA